MKIIQLKSENVKRLKAVTINPDGAIVCISGKNGQGKSSVLDSIAMVFGGKDFACDVPVRNGEKKAKVSCTLDEDLIATRTFTADGGGTLTVTNAKGMKYPSPQAMLDKLVGKLTLDPLAFVKLPAKQQAEMLRGLVGLDFTKVDQERAEKYAERTAVNRSLAAAQSQVNALPMHADAPAKEVTISELMEELAEADKTNGVRRFEVQRLETNRNTASRTRQAIIDLKNQLDLKQRELAEIEECIAMGEKDVARTPQIDTAPIKQKISDTDSINRKVRDNLRREEAEDHAEGYRKRADELTSRIEAIDAEKQSALAEAKFPIPDLSFDESGVLYRGVPFAQASSAEQLRISAAIGLALNPKLRVLLIRDGSLLDSDSLKLLAEFAEANDAQVWVERVEDGDAVGVVIEDGCVAGAEVEVAAPTLATMTPAAKRPVTVSQPSSPPDPFDEDEEKPF